MPYSMLIIGRLVGEVFAEAGSFGPFHTNGSGFYTSQRRRDRRIQRMSSSYSQAAEPRQDYLAYKLSLPPIL